MERLRVSVLVPCCEPNPAHLRSALDSLLAQTFSRWTAFIRDDASGADVRTIVEPYLRDSRFTVVRGDRRLGIGGNWNACLRRTLEVSTSDAAEDPARAPCLQFLFQDDLWEPTYLERCVEVLDRHPEVGFVAANHAYVCESGGEPEPYDEVLAARAALAPGLQRREEFLRSWLEAGLRPNVIGEPSFVMLRRSLVERVGFFDDAMPQGLDFEYWIRCLLHADWWWIPEALGTFRVHSAAASARNRRGLRGAFDRLRCFRMLLRELPPGDLRQAAKRGRRRYLRDALGRALRG